jgi:hypothetical protein
VHCKPDVFCVPDIREKYNQLKVTVCIIIIDLGNEWLILDAPVASSAVGSEVARLVALALATVRRSNCTGSFPAYSFYEDSRFRGTIVGIN